MPLTYKHCSACGGGPWPPQRFYKTGKRKDGSIRRDKKCKDCRYRFNQENRQLKAEHYREYDRQRANRSDVIAQRKAYLKTLAGHAARRRKTRAWRVTHPELYAAQNARSSAALRRKRAAEAGNDASIVRTRIAAAFSSAPASRSVCADSAAADAPPAGHVTSTAPNRSRRCRKHSIVIIREALQKDESVLPRR